MSSSAATGKQIRLAKLASASGHEIQRFLTVEFKDDKGNMYSCAEQYMMAEKAKLFGDYKMLTQIMVSDEPKKQKEFGRRVKNFDSKIWDEKCCDIVTRGNVFKFSQNPELKKYLLSTYPAMIAEASAWDRTWGLGIGVAQAKITPPEKWPGKNLLGKCLMAAREILMRNENTDAKYPGKEIKESKEVKG